MDDLILQFEDSSELNLVLDGGSELELVLDNVQQEFPTYDGPTEFTPTQETQTVLTARRVLLENITINPIPQNYGLITYNGNIITVS